MMRVAACLLAMGLSILPGRAAAQDRTHRLKERMALPMPIDEDELIAHRIAGSDRIRDPREGSAIGIPIYVQVTVDPTGKVIGVGPSERRYEPPLPDGLLETLRASVQEWRFRPFERHGGPIAVRGDAFVNVLPMERLPSRHIPFPKVPREEVTITFDRHGTWIPGYRVIVHGDGQVMLQGAMLGPRTRSYSIPVAAVDALIARFRAADFWSLDERYELAGARDLPTTTLTFGAGGIARTVIDYGGDRVGMPDSVGALEDAIDQAVDVDRWMIGNSATVAALRAEHFDFTSAAAAEIFAQMIYRAPEPVLREMLAHGVNLDLDSGDGKCIGCRAGRTYREAAAENATAFKRDFVLELIRR